MEKVQSDSLLTLHYQLVAEGGPVLVNTFDASPATFQMGCGELAPPLEACLMTMSVGQKEQFTLPPERAFGPYNPALVQRIARADLPANSDELKLHDEVGIPGPAGARITGRVMQIDNETVLLDFNHPLAGQTLRFEAEVVGIL